MITETVSILVNKKQYLRGTLFSPQQKKNKLPAVLFVHGWTSSENGYWQYAQALTKLGAISLTINLRGHGTSSGELNNFSRQDHLQDLIAAYDFLAAHPAINSAQIGAVGSSYGGYLLAILSGERHFQNLTLRSPALYRDENFTVPTARLIQEDEEVFRQENLHPEQSKALRAIAQYTGYFLLVESELDTVCPPNTTRNYLKAVNQRAKTARITLPQVGHVLDTPEAQQAFSRTLSARFQTFAFNNL
jgi:dipeptidyl aminopeptidase/acylaminoacyl peptidase